MNKYVLYLIFSVLLMSCSDNSVNEPKHDERPSFGYLRSDNTFQHITSMNVMVEDLGVQGLYPLMYGNQALTIRILREKDTHTEDINSAYADSVYTDVVFKDELGNNIGTSVRMTFYRNDASAPEAPSYYAFTSRRYDIDESNGEITKRGKVVFIVDSTEDTTPIETEHFYTVSSKAGKETQIHVTVLVDQF